MEGFLGFLMVVCYILGIVATWGVIKVLFALAGYLNSITV